MPQIEELMQLVIDGVATPAEERELRAALEHSSVAREQFEGLQTIAKSLDAAPVADAPGIKQAVMAQIRPLRAAPAHSSRPVRRRWIAFAYAAAAVMVIGIAVHRAVPPPRDSAATMARIEEEWPVVARAASGNTRMTVRGSRGEFVVEVSPKLPYALQWDASRLERIEPNRFRKVGGASGPTVITLRLQDQSELRVTIDLR